LTHPWNASDLKEYFRCHVHGETVRFRKKSTIRYAVRMSGTEIATISHVRVYYFYAEYFPKNSSKR